MEKIEKLIIATHNSAKLIHYQAALAEFADTVLCLKDFNINEKPEETGETAEENAGIKARYYCAKTGEITLSEDEALYADFLSDAAQPGVRVRRINGVEETSDEKLLAHWERMLAPVPQEHRFGHWHIAYALAYPNGKTNTVAQDRAIKFFLPASPIRTPGWPLSSLEGWIEFNKPHSEWNDEEKQQAAQRTKNELSQIFMKLSRD